MFLDDCLTEESRVIAAGVYRLSFYKIVQLIVVSDIARTALLCKPALSTIDAISDDGAKRCELR